MEKAGWHSIQSKASTTFVTYSVPAKTICGSDSEFAWKADVYKQDSPKQEIQKDYYCLIAALFFPWNFDTQLNSDNTPWKQFFHDNRYHLSPRISRYINNLDLLHKTSEETRIDYLQWKAQEDLQVPGDLSILFDDNIEGAIEDADDFDASDRSYSTAVNQAISTFKDSGDNWYTWEALDSCEDNRYLQSSPSSLHQNVYHLSQRFIVLRESLKLFSATTTTMSQDLLMTISQATSNHEIQPHVFLTDGIEYQCAILEIVNRFTLNDK